MAKPATKSELVTAATDQFSKLWTLIDGMDEQMQNADFQFDEAFLEKKKEAHWKRDKNLRDTLIHLHEWHNLLLSWVTANQKGDAKPFIPEPYN